MLTNKVHSAVNENTMTKDTIEPTMMAGSQITDPDNFDGQGEISACMSIRTSLSPIITWLKVFGFYYDNPLCADIARLSDANPKHSHAKHMEQWAHRTDINETGAAIAPRSSKSLGIYRVFTAISSSLTKYAQFLHQSYCIIVSLLLVANFLKSLLLLFRGSGFGMSYRVVMVIWYSHTTLGSLALHYSCRKDNHFK